MERSPELPRHHPGSSVHCRRSWCAVNDFRYQVCALIVLVGFGCRSREHTIDARFVLPGWEDVALGSAPPHDVELTCNHPNDTAECHAIRSTAPIREVIVTRRPDAMGVMTILTSDADDAAIAQVRSLWGQPTVPPTRGGSREHHEALWCSPDGKQAASIEEAASIGGQRMPGSVVITMEPGTWLLQECAGVQAHEGVKR